MRAPLRVRGSGIASLGWTELPEQLDLLLQLDRRERMPEGQALQPLELGQPLKLPGPLLGGLPLGLHLAAHVASSASRSSPPARCSAASLLACIWLLMSRAAANTPSTLPPASR